MKMMIRLAVLGLGAAVLTPSIAAAQSSSGVGATYNLFSGTANSGTFGNSAIGDMTFTNTFTFIVTRSGVLASDFTNAASRNGQDSDIDFTSGTLTGGSLTMPLAYSRLLGEPLSLTEVWGVTPLMISAGTYTLTIAGRAYGPTSTFAGNFNVVGVPEPTTWAMMIAGVGLVGGAMRRRTTTKVSFA